MRAKSAKNIIYEPAVRDHSSLGSFKIPQHNSIEIYVALSHVCAYLFGRTHLDRFKIKNQKSNIYDVNNARFVFPEFFVYLALTYN